MALGSGSLCVNGQVSAHLYSMGRVRSGAGIG